MEETFNNSDVVINDFDIESSAKMEQAVKDFNFKCKNKGMTNIDLELKRIGLRVQKMLVAFDRKLYGEHNLQKKYFKIWQGDRFPDALTSLRRILENDLTSFCDVETEIAFKMCFETRRYFYNINK